MPTSKRGSYARRQLSRSKVELFLECPRCLWLDVRRGVRRVSGPAFTLNLAVDELLKHEFDSYRKKKAPHPYFADAGIDAVPFAHPDLDTWRKNFTGVRWKDADSGWTFFGAVDDVWQEPSGRLIVADYKATAKAVAPTTETLYQSYPRQMDMYQFLLRRQGFDVSDRAWFVYANGDKKRPRFDGALTFDMLMVPYDGDDSWVAGAWKRAVACVESDAMPDLTVKCEWCRYREQAKLEEGPSKGQQALDL